METQKVFLSKKPPHMARKERNSDVVEQRSRAFWCGASEWGSNHRRSETGHRENLQEDTEKTLRPKQKAAAPRLLNDHQRLNNGIFAECKSKITGNVVNET